MALLCAFFATLLAVAGLAPSAVWLLLGAATALGVILLAWRHLIGFSVAWLLLAGISLEMTLNDLIGPSAYGATIAVVKAAELSLAGLCMLRYGPRLDMFNPAWAAPRPERRR
jgi:Na+-translocating ferredoxin:NAD+ oxidoreductase RnfA subunit